jgi:hypothetical protein
MSSPPTILKADEKAAELQKFQQKRRKATFNGTL